jgi:PAS domain S-box-containing protein
MKHFFRTSDMSDKPAILEQWLTAVGCANVLAALSDLVENGAVYALDGEGRIVFWSRGAQRMLGFAADEVLGRMASMTVVCRECDGLSVLMQKGRLDDEPTVV